MCSRKQGAAADEARSSEDQGHEVPAKPAKDPGERLNTHFSKAARPCAETALQGTGGCVGTGQEAVQSAQRGTVAARTEVLAAGQY